MLRLHRNNVTSSRVRLDPGFFMDLNWFVFFLEQYNGVAFYYNRPLNHTIYLDASLTGLGGNFHNMAYALSLTSNFRDYNIVHLEIINLFVALKV